MAIELIALDVEGVITPAGGGTKPCDMAALHLISGCLERFQCPVILATGRQQPYAEHALQTLGAAAFRRLPEPLEINGTTFEGCPSVVENGAIFYEPVKGKNRVNPKIADLSAYNKIRDTVKSIVEELGGKLELGKEICLSVNPPQGWDTPLLRQHIVQELNRSVPRWSEWCEITRSVSAVDLTPHGISKRSAVEDVLGWLRDGGVLAPDDRILGVGDSTGDIDWLQFVASLGGIIALPSNGEGIAHNFGHCYISPHPEAQGLLDILEHLLATPRPYS